MKLKVILIAIVLIFLCFLLSFAYTISEGYTKLSPTKSTSDFLELKNSEWTETYVENKLESLKRNFHERNLTKRTFSDNRSKAIKQLKMEFNKSYNRVRDGKWIGNKTKVKQTIVCFNETKGLPRNCSETEIQEKVPRKLFSGSPIILLTLGDSLAVTEAMHKSSDLGKGGIEEYGEVLTKTFTFAAHASMASSLTSFSRSFLQNCTSNESSVGNMRKCNIKLLKHFENISDKLDITIQRRNFDNCARYIPLKTINRLNENVSDKYKSSSNPILRAIYGIYLKSSKYCSGKTYDKISQGKICIRPKTSQLEVLSLSKILNAGGVYTDCMTSELKDQLDKYGEI